MNIQFDMHFLMNIFTGKMLVTQLNKLELNFEIIAEVS